MPDASFSDDGMAPDGLIGSGSGSGCDGARETRIVNSAVQGRRSAAEMPNSESWWLRQMPSGCACAVTVYLPGRLGAVYSTRREFIGSANEPPDEPSSHSNTNLLSSSSIKVLSNRSAMP